MNWGRDKWFILLFLLIVALVLSKVVTRFFLSRGKESFRQLEPYTCKTNAAIYDNFYAQVYNELHCPQKDVPLILDQLVDTLQPSHDFSHFLVVGSGTGYTVNELAELGYNAKGIDKSDAMIAHSKKKYPKCEFVNQDATKPTAYPDKSFTHILCLHDTIYEIQDKSVLFKNAHNWLKNGGYFVLQLSEPDKYDTMIMHGKTMFYEPPKKQVESYELNMSDYKYKFKKEGTDGVCNVCEKFVDSATGHIRENKNTLYMEPIGKILSELREAGFILHGQMNMKKCNKDEHKILVIASKS